MEHPSRVFRRIEHVVTREIAGEFLLVPIKGRLADLQQIFAVNEVGRFIWEQLDGRRDLAQLHAALLYRFDVTPAQAQADLGDFIRHLWAAELLEEVSP